MDDAARNYIDGIDPLHRPLFDRVQGLVLEERPDVTIGLSYGIPTYRVGKRRLYLGVWQHGVSLYGFSADQDGGFLARHPDLRSGKGTIRLPTRTAAEVPDEDLRALIRATLLDKGGAPTNENDQRRPAN